MILHIAYYDKFIPGFITFNESNFGASTQRYWIISYPLNYKKIIKDNVYYTGRGRLQFMKDFFVLIYFLVTSKKIFLHGIPGRFTHIAISLCPWVLKKCYWLIWGADIHDKRELRSWDFLNKLDKLIFDFVKRNAGFLVTYIASDLNEARRRFGAKGKFHKCLLYPGNTFSPLKKEVSQVQNNLLFLVGHSAHPGNKHQKIFEMLKRYEKLDFEIYSPLAYGDFVYAKAVSDIGSKLFGEKFHPVFKFLPLAEYRSFLSKIDIGIFNLERQQAMGNIIALLGSGKKVVINPNSPVLEDFRALGLRIFTWSNFDLSKLNNEDAENNRRIISSEFSNEALINQYKKIYFDDISSKQV